MDLNLYLENKRSAINKALVTSLHTYTMSPRLFEPMSYCIQAGGKRLRPVLCIAAYEALTDGSGLAAVLPVACALEMIHTYSLIHDDLPALDDDHMRRGTPTCHIRFNEATAVLAGDGLLNTAFELLADWAADPGDDKAPHLPVDIRLEVIQTIARAAGCRGMIEGQARDLAFEGRTINLADLEQLHRLKTGAMIRAAVMSGALIGRADQHQLASLRRYSIDLGLAFQVVDDILNVVGDPKILGKAVGTDSERQKNTYPALLGLDGAREKAAELVASALEALAQFDSRAEPLRAIAGYVLARNR